MMCDMQDYIQEGERQANPDNDEKLDSDPTDILNRYITHLIYQACRLNIISECTRNSVTIKNLRMPAFYMLPKIHKHGNPGRLIVSGIG